MKNFILFLAGIISAAVFTPQASALPVFARQTGMECAACHFQHFPMLTAFGRAFKASGFTMMGAQAKVEGDNLSIPVTLNAAILATMGYSKNNSDSAAISAPSDYAAGARNSGDGAFYVPGTNGEFSIFVGGHVSDNAGALAELGMVQDAGTGAGLSSAKMPMLWEITDYSRAGLVPFTTDGQGSSYGYESLNTGANAVHTMLFIGGDFNESVGPALSAQQYIGTGAAATGAAFVLNNPGYFFNLTKFNQVGPADLGGGGATMSSTYFRAVKIFDLSGWDTAVGVQSWSGKSSAVEFSDVVGPATCTAAAGDCTAELLPSFTLMETRAWAVDGQTQGEWNKMPLGVYFSYARAPANTSGGMDCVTAGVTCNAFNGGTMNRSSFNVSAELGVIPEKATIGIGVRRGKSGIDNGTGTNASDNAVLIEASYKLAQNMLLNLYYTSQSGDYWDASTGNTAAIGSKQTVINLATIF